MKRNSLKQGKFSTYIIFFVMILFVFSDHEFAQQTVDKIVATVSDGGRPELITYSDLVWQLALVPDVKIDPPTSQDLNRALQVLIRQRLIALEARRLPREDPSVEEVNNEIKRIVNLFPTTGEFVNRLRTVGFDSIDDDNFQRMIGDRVAIEKYVDFRFRSFVVITLEDELRYYRDEFTPEFRRQNPGLLLPPLEQVRDRIIEILTERKVESDIETFLDEARNRADIVTLSEV